MDTGPPDLFLLFQLSTVPTKILVIFTQEEDLNYRPLTSAGSHANIRYCLLACQRTALASPAPAIVAEGANAGRPIQARRGDDLPACAKYVLPHAAT